MGEVQASLSALVEVQTRREIGPHTMWRSSVYTVLCGVPTWTGDWVRGLTFVPGYGRSPGRQAKYFPC